MTYTRGIWSHAFCVACGNDNPTPPIVQWVAAWSRCETPVPLTGASYNLLNTTEPNTPGVVSDFNSVGVKNYDTFEHGIDANAKVLQNGLYPSLLLGVKGITNNIFTPGDSGVLRELSTWGTGNVQLTILRSLGLGMNDEFIGNVPTPPVSDEWDDIAKSEFEAVIPGIDRTTGIAVSWLAAFKADTFLGPALCREYRKGDFSYQYFPGGYCIWSHLKHAPAWNKYT